MPYHKTKLTGLDDRQRKELLESSLKANEHNTGRVAKLLGVSQSLVWRYIKQYGIPHDGFAWRRGRR